MIHVGISGWRYAPWRGVFYPRGLPQRRELAYVAETLGTVEINGSFYSLQRPALYARWFAETPASFVFAVKGSRFITHMRRLRGVEQALANFFASGLFELREKLGPILWQLPATFAYDVEKLEAFFALLPRDTDEMARLARRRDGRLTGRARIKPYVDQKVRHCIEVRHESFLVPAFTAQLRRHGIALVVADAAGLYPERHDLTAGFAYVRLHGADELYRSGYDDAALRKWAARIRGWHEGRQLPDAKLVGGTQTRGTHDVYCYFDNDAKVHAPFDAQRLAALLAAGPENRVQEPRPLRVSDPDDPDLPSARRVI